MSQRNPMNDRYQTDERKGQTRKSAASMKPKTRAASSVRVESTVKTPKQKKAAKKVEQTKRTALDRMYYNPPTAEYKKLRKVWWGLLIGAMAFTALSFAGRSVLPDATAYVMLGLAYACIIGALYVDFSKIRKIRRAYQEEMESRKTKEQRSLEKQAKAAEKQEAVEKIDATQEEKPKKRGLFGNGFRLPKTESSKGVASEDAVDSKNDKNVVLNRAKADTEAAGEAVSKDTNQKK